MTDNLYRLTDARAAAKVVEHILNDVPHDGRFEVEVRKYRKRRSPEANRYYFGVCVQTMGRELGYRVDEMHDVLLMGYFGTEEKEFRGKRYLFPKRRTTAPDTVSSVEFQGLIQYAQQVASEMGITLPDQEGAACST